MPARPQAPPLTVAEYQLLPETGPRYQLIEGDLYMAPAPNRAKETSKSPIFPGLEIVLEKVFKK